jgi:hypothetical protein
LQSLGSLPKWFGAPGFQRRHRLSSHPSGDRLRQHRHSVEWGSSCKTKSAHGDQFLWVYLRQWLNACDPRLDCWASVQPWFGNYLVIIFPSRIFRAPLAREPSQGRGDWCALSSNPNGVNEAGGAQIDWTGSFVLGPGAQCDSLGRVWEIEVELNLSSSLDQGFKKWNSCHT